jgi:transcriptional regulator with XRE-family HTH domain
MPNTKKWSEIRSTRSKPGVIDRANGRQKQRAALLGDLRRARQLTQETLAETLGMSQSEVSKVERRSDLYVSTLRRYIEAMGGELQIFARFPNGEVEIVQIAPQRADQEVVFS